MFFLWQEVLIFLNMKRRLGLKEESDGTEVQFFPAQTAALFPFNSRLALWQQFCKVLRCVAASREALTLQRPSGRDWKACCFSLLFFVRVLFAVFFFCCLSFVINEALRIRLRVQMALSC